MSSVTVDLGAATGTQPPVEWPDRCACCGKPSPGSHGALTHTILSISNTAPGTVLAEPLLMHWRVPTCPACLEHQRVAASRSPISASGPRRPGRPRLAGHGMAALHHGPQ